MLNKIYVVQVNILSTVEKGCFPQLLKKQLFGIISYN